MFYKNKRVLVTGGTGFIGSHIVRALSKVGASVRVPVHIRHMPPDIKNVETVRADLMQWEDCRAAARGVDYVVHAAGTVGAAGVKDYQLMEGITKNLILTAHMLQAAWAEGTKRIVVFGSSTGYPACDHPVTEEEMWLDEPHPAYASYGWMRRYVEKLGEYVSGQSGCKVLVIRPSAVYGPGDNFTENTSHVIPALIKRAVERENPYIVWGTGDEVRDFIHVSDFARACLLALAKYNVFDTVNIGAGKGSTIRDVVRLILDVVGHSDVEILFDRTKPAAIPFRIVDIGKARRVLLFEPQISLEEGIKDTAEWYIKTLARKS